MYKTTKLYEEDGFVYRDEMSKKGTPVKKYCFRAVHVTRILQDLTTRKIDLEISYEYNGKTNSLIVSRSVLTRFDVLRTFPAYGIDVRDSNVLLFLEWVTASEQYAKVSYIHTQLGWCTIDGEKVYLLDEAISKSNSIRSSYPGKLKIHKTGSIDDHLKLLEGEVKGNSALEFAYTAGLSSVLIGYIKDYLNIPVIIVHFYGSSSTGKSSLLNLAISAYGDSGKGKDSLMLTWFSTFNSIVGFMKDKNGLVFAIDETSGRLSDTGPIVYSMNEGVTKGRADKEGNMQERSDFSGAVLSTGEGPLLGNESQFEGLRVRVIEVSLKSFTKSAENSKAIQRGVMKSNGHTARLFAAYLLELGEEAVIQRFKQAHDTVMSRLEVTDSMSDRVADRFAIIYLTGVLLNECLDLGFDVDAVLDLLIKVESESVMERDLGEKAYRALIEYAAKNPKSFYRWQKDEVYKANHPLDETVISFQEIKGRIDLQRQSAIGVYYQKDTLDEVLRDNGFKAPRVAIKAMEAKNLLILDNSGKYQVNRKLYPTAISRSRVYGLRIEPETIVSDESEPRLKVVKKKSQRKMPPTHGMSIEEMLDEEN